MPVLSLSRPHPRALLAFAHDLVAVALTWCTAFWLRFNLEVPPDYAYVMVARLPYVLAVHALLFWPMGLYRGLWRYASIHDLQRILLTVGVTGLAVPATLVLLQLDTSVPRSVYLVAPVLLIGMMSISRLLYRGWKERGLLGFVAHPNATPVLVLGAGDAGVLLLRDLANSRTWRVLGLLDDDPDKRGASIGGVRVLGTISQVGEFAARLGVTQVVIAMPSATHATRKRAADLCAEAGLRAMTVPALSDIAAGKVSVSALRNIELDDLLGRDPVALDQAGIEAFLRGSTVLVTGAGGSIGSELCRQISRFGPTRLVLFDHSEYALYAIEQEFSDRHGAIDVVAAIGDARDAARLGEVFARWRPAVVFHAAAYKHVPLMEQDNAFQAVRNNVLGTLTVARAAIAHGARKFVLVSTDKAVNPTNVMGASKRLAELVCRALQRGRETQFVIVRFGNVLGSTGSVVPRFRRQIEAGGPVTVTHPDIQRYFMSIPEAAQLVLQAALMGNGGEIFVLDMGEPVRIVDLARQLIRLSGLTEDDIRIEYTGLRPGEKLFEELLADEEHTLPTPHPKLRVARATTHENANLDAEVQLWLETAGRAESDEVRARLQQWIPEYRPARVADAAAVAG